MSNDGRLSAAEECLMRLQLEQQQLDAVIQAQARVIAELQRRIQQLERNLDQHPPGDE